MDHLPVSATASYSLPGDRVFPESVGVDPRTGSAYVGSLADGAIYRISPTGEVEVVSPAGADERRSVAGVKVDGDGRLWAAGGYEGTLCVYELASGSLLARHAVGERPTCVNDLAFGPDGAAFVTDSFVPKLFRVDPGSLELTVFVDLVADGTIPWPSGLNLNGIVLAPDGRHLITCQTNTGRFWQVSLDDASVAEVVVEGGPLVNCDGLAIADRTLYVAINAGNEIAVLELSESTPAHAVMTRRLTSDAFAFPTALAVRDDALLVVNGQLDRMSATPALPFSVIAIARPGG